MKYTIPGLSWSLKARTLAQPLLSNLYVYSFEPFLLDLSPMAFFLFDDYEGP